MLLVWPFFNVLTGIWPVWDLTWERALLLRSLGSEGYRIFLTLGAESSYKATVQALEHYFKASINPLEVRINFHRFYQGEGESIHPPLCFAELRQQHSADMDPYRMELLRTILLFINLQKKLWIWCQIKMTMQEASNMMCSTEGDDSSVQVQKLTYSASNTRCFNFWGRRYKRGMKLWPVQGHHCGCYNKLNHFAECCFPLQVDLFII